MSLPTELHERCLHPESSIRLLAVQEMAELLRTDNETSTAVQQECLRMASTDSDNHVRIAAAQLIEDLTLLEQLSQLTRHKDKAVYKFCKEKLDAAQQRKQAQDILVNRANEICRSIEALAGKVPGPLSPAQMEYLVAQWQQVSSAADEALHERFAAACTTLQEKITNYLSERNQEVQFKEGFDQLQAALNNTQLYLADLSASVDQEIFGNVEALLHELQSLSAAFPINGLDDEARSLTRQCTNFLSLLTEWQQAWRLLEGNRSKLDKLLQAIEKASHKDLRALSNLKKQFDKLFSAQPWPAGFPVSDLYLQCQQAQLRLQQIAQKNNEWQQKLLTDAMGNIIALEQHIEQGLLNDAQSLWDKLQSVASRIGDQHRQTLQEHLAPFRKRIAELQDWKNFAATEKKKELITRMQALTEAQLAPPQKAKLIRGLQEDWKTLGHSSDNDSLWAQFTELAHKAFEPCKEYFKERKVIMTANLQERTRICEELEQYIGALTPETVNIADTAKLESAAQAEWKKYAPVAQNKIKSLQKRFSGILNSLRHLKRKTMQTNAARKTALIEQARSLLEQEDLQSALSAARKLQAEWKLIGPSPFKEDRKHWNDFRETCDKLFAKRVEIAKEQKTAERKTLNEARTTLKKISNLLDLTDEEFLQSRKLFAELKTEFYSHLNPEMKAERRQLIEQFEKIAVKYDSRHKAAPDRRSLQLINQVKARAIFCQELEANLLGASTNSSTDTQALQEQWLALENVSETALAQALEKRFKQIAQLGSDESKLQKLYATNETLARELCVEMEIQAGIDSPTQDKALRMKLQLNHLKQDFGRNKNVGKTRVQIVQELELQFLSMGPLDDATRVALQTRINSIKSRLS